MVPATKPRNDPNPERNATLLFFPATSSPITAPMKGPIIRPNGGKKNIPIIKPIVAPHIPVLEPPSFLVPQMGTK